MYPLHLSMCPLSMLLVSCLFLLECLILSLGSFKCPLVLVVLVPYDSYEFTFNVAHHSLSGCYIHQLMSLYSGSIFVFFPLSLSLSLSLSLFCSCLRFLCILYMYGLVVSLVISYTLALYMGPCSGNLLVFSELILFHL